jgi:uncharacterized protein YijF (DUF1287 family)
VSEAERVAHRLNAEADRHKQLALDASNVDDRMFHRLMFHLCREAASKTLLAEEDFQAGDPKLCVMKAYGGNVHAIITGTQQEDVNFPAWGSHPPEH